MKSAIHVRLLIITRYGFNLKCLELDKLKVGKNE